MVGIGGIVLACSQPPGAPASDAGDPAVVDAGSLVVARARSLAVPTCPDPAQAPLRTGEGIDVFRCETVGASAASGDARWPETTGLVAPVVYVDPSAMAGGDGSRERPFATLGAAVAASPRTVAFSRGEHPVPPSFTASSDLDLVGVGAGTVLRVVRDSAGFVFRGGARVALRGCVIVGPEAPGEGVVLVRVAGATLSLDDVSLDGGYDALRVDDGALLGARVTVRRAVRYGVFAGASARVTLDGFVVRDGLAQGIRAEGGRLSLRRGLVADNARHGVVMLGDVSATGGWARCDGTDVAGSRDCVVQVASHGNGVAGMYVEGRRTVSLSRVSLSGTRLVAIEGGSAGDGLVVGPASTVAVDEDVTDVARRGTASAVLANGRVGVLAQGLNATVTIRGALIGANASGAVLLTGNASAPMIGECLVQGNRFGGILVAPGARASIVQCNGIVDTQEGALETNVGTLTLADGLHVNAPSGEARFVENVVSGSRRFGLIVNATRGASEGNRGEANRYGVGLYGGASLSGNLEAIRGTERAPTATPALLTGL